MSAPLRGDRALGFPFTLTGGRLRTSAVTDTLHGRIVQVLFTQPGERVGLPEFGCGLFRLVFEPNDELLAAALGYTVREALDRWLGDEIAVDGVDISHDGGQVLVEVAYTRRADLVREGLRLRFQEGSPWTTS
jgi:phage baseplate assembly protein W